MPKLDRLGLQVPKDNSGQSKNKKRMIAMSALSICCLRLWPQPWK